MTRSTSVDGITQRTYPMSERCRQIIDSIDIVVPGYSKSDLVNLAVFFTSAFMSDYIRDTDGSDVKEAVEYIRRFTAEHGYELIQNALMTNLKVTKLDRFFDMDEGDR